MTTNCTSPCLAHCSRIHRYVAAEKWAAEIEAVPEECREFVRQYLRGIWRRIKVAEAARAAVLPPEFGYRPK